MHTHEEANALVREFHKTKPSERLGQFLMNRMPIRVQDDDLFYCRDDDEAASKYFTRYVVASMEDVKAWSKKCDDHDVPRVDVEAVKKKIFRIQFTQVQTSVFCYITRLDGYVFEGHSATVTPARYDFAVGKKFAYERAFAAMVEAEANVLREKLFAEGKTWII